MKPPLTYRLLKAYTRLGLLIYFRKWQNVNTDLIPAEGPFIFVANHQNAFLDALLVVCGIKRNPWFLARGDVFKNKWAKKLLTFLRIKPIYRFRDGHAAIRNNDKIIGECVELLKQSECLLLFGEGNHNQPYTSRHLQRGFAHVALEYMEQTGNDIVIVPVGYHYEKHDAFRSRVLVRYGEPVSVSAITRTIEDKREKFQPLLHEVGTQLRKLILIVPLDEHYIQRKQFLLQNRVYKNDMQEQLEADRDLMHRWKPSDKPFPPVHPFWKLLNPVTAYGKLMHLIPDAFLNYLTTKAIKDDQFVGSIQVGAGIFLIPLYYFALTMVCYWITQDPWITVLFLLSLPLSGLFAYSKK
jgi:1-acyl-sn-glycerol-3-phosphate acyltransferase